MPRGDPLPCCYHLIRTSHYRPLSGPAKASVLQLAKSDLKLPLQETVTGGARIARLREQEVAWRLAFDCLQRQVRGVDEYLPVPNMQKSLLTGTFEDFCGWAAERKGLVLPTGLEYAGFLAKGRRAMAMSPAWSWYVTCFVARWNSGWCWIAPSSCKSRATGWRWASFATSP